MSTTSVDKLPQPVLGRWRHADRSPIRRMRLSSISLREKLVAVARARDQHVVA
jgi:hypothetical protein